MSDYNKRLVEVDEILNYLSEDDLLKIPQDVRKAIKENKDKEYIWNYDETKPLKEQEVSRDTIAILSYLNMEYLLNEEKKDFMKQLHNANEKKLEDSGLEKYGVENLFKEAEIEQEDLKEAKKSQELSLVENKESFFTKIIKNIKKIFGR